MADTYSRLYKTNLSGFHQLIALNQSYVNQSFKNMYKLAMPDSALKAFNRTVRGIGRMTNCKLLEPEVKFMVEDNDYNYLKYYLKFETGTLEIEYGDDSVRTFDVAGWIFVFRIFIGNKPVEKDSPEWKELVKRVVFDGDFSLSKLWLDSMRADTSNKRLQAESYFGGLDWSKEPEEVQENFDTFIQKWIQAVDREGSTLVGVSIHTTEGAASKATFAPTWFAKQTYPWQDPQKEPPPPPKNDLPNNMLLYLMMSGGVNPPTPALLQPPNGMWNDPTQEIQGTYALSNELFWYKWLLPFLMKFNRATQFYTTQMSCWTEDDERFIAQYNWLIGQNPQQDSYFVFKGGVPSPKVYGFNFGQDIGEFDVGNSAGNWYFKGEARQTGSNKTYVEFKPNSKEIEISGAGKAWCRMDLKGASTPPWDTYVTLDVTLTWSMTLIIDSISEGGLEVKIKEIGKDEKFHSVTYNVEDHLDWPGMSSNFEEYGKWVTGYLDSVFSWTIPSLQRDLLNKLNNQNKLFLPGSGSYFFKNGTFNSHGDFLVETKYDGQNWDRAKALAARADTEQKAAEIVVPPKPEPLKPLTITFDLKQMKNLPGYCRFTPEDGKLEADYLENGNPYL